MSLNGDAFNKSTNTVLYFVSSVQDCCDKHRLSLESKWFEEATSYFKQRRQIQNETKKVSEKKNQEENSSNDFFVKELEELTLADSLLKKARLIRKKNQNVLNGFRDYINISQMSTNFSIMESTCNSLCKETYKNKISSNLPHSKSDIVTSNHKNVVVKRSKSASATIVQKENELCINKCSHTRSLKNVSSKNHQSAGKKAGCLASISNKDQGIINRLHAQYINSHISCDMNEEKKQRISDSSENKLSLQHFPARFTSKEFVDFYKGKLSAHSSILKVKLWYPYVSLKSEKFLTSLDNKSLCSYRHIHNKLYNIQEMMMWIDLLHIIESEICPNLPACKKNINLLKICSYLQSLFLPTSQKIPILDPNG